MSRVVVVGSGRGEGVRFAKSMLSHEHRKTRFLSITPNIHNFTTRRLTAFDFTKDVNLNGLKPPQSISATHVRESQRRLFELAPSGRVKNNMKRLSNAEEHGASRVAGQPSIAR